MDKRQLASRLATGVVVVLLVLYPALAYLGLRYLHPGWLAGLLILVCAARLLVARIGRVPAFTATQLLLVCGGGIVLALVSVLQDKPDAMLYYPALVNGAMLCVFGYSLMRPPTVVERIATLQEGPLPHEAVIYTRRVTIAWVLFFVFNGSIALYTALLTPLETWALYNGIVAYVLIGAMFGGELLMRGRFMKRLRP
jgi:uncharacterized membrane protein